MHTYLSSVAHRLLPLGFLSFVLVVLLAGALLPTNSLFAQDNNSTSTPKATATSTATAIVIPTITSKSSVTASVTVTANAALTSAASTPTPIVIPTVTSAKQVTASFTAIATVRISATAAATVAPATIQETTLITPSGPAFDWSSSDNYLILGTDRRPNWTDWRTDTIIIVGLDRVNERAAVFSVPRDLYVQIPGRGYARINTTDYLGESRNGEGGGPALVSQVLSETLGVATDHWVRVQMDGFISFVDAIGGVTITLDCPFSEPILNLNTGLWDEFTLPAGEVLLDGQDAYWFVRLRLRESDIGRSSRQRQFLWALREKMSKTNLLAQAPALWDAFQNTISTDLSLFEIIELGQVALTLKPENVRASALTLADLQDFTTSDGQRVLRIGNTAYVRAKIANIWAAPSMEESYRRDAQTCQPVRDLSGTIAGGAPVQPQSVGTPVAERASTIQDADNAAEAQPATTPAPAASSKNAPAGIAVGVRVRIRKALSLIVRSQPNDNAGRVVGSMADGEQAVVLGGPATSDGNGDTIVWWYVRTDSGTEGWIPANTATIPLLEIIQ